MTDLERLVAAAKPAAQDTSVPTFMLDDDAPDGALDALVEYFGADRTRAGVRLVVGGAEVGYLPREALYERAIVVDRGFGGSAGAALPGMPSFGGSAHANVPGKPTGGGVLTLHCPVAGCTAGPVFAVSYDEDYPPHCRLHPESVLVLE